LINDFPFMRLKAFAAQFNHIVSILHNHKKESKIADRSSHAAKRFLQENICNSPLFFAISS